MRRGHALAVLVVLLTCVSAPGAGRAAGSNASTPVIPADDKLKAAFEALPDPDRRAIQDALLWTGDYSGVVNGTFGPRTRDALAGFAKKNALTVDAVLDPKSRARLISAAASARAEVGFATVKDKPAGVAMSLPLKLLPRKTATEGGTHYASSDGAFVADTLSRPAGPGGLPEVFDRMSTASGQRKVTYKLLKPDFFVVSGEIGERKFYSRFVLGTLDAQVLVRGLTLAYPKQDAARLDPIVLAAAGSFDAFPNAAQSAITPGAPMPPIKPPPPPATYALNAIRVGPGVVLTHLSPAPCINPTMAGAPVTPRQADKASGLALFEGTPGAGAAFALSSKPVTQDATLFVIFGHDQQGLDVAPAELQPALANALGGMFTISAGIQGRAEGAPVVDRQGRLAGLATEPKRLSPSIAGMRLQNDYPIVDSSELKAFLAQAGISPAPADGAPPQNLGAVTELWKPLLVRIVCQVAAAP